MHKATITVVCAALAMAGCARMATPRPAAIAILQPTQDSSVRGTVSFTPQGDHMVVVANVTGLAPGPHGFHVHEKGDCSAADAMSAGEHFNPDGRPHGSSWRDGGHAGDFGNLIADNTGVAQTRMEVEGITLDPGASHNILGRSVIVHANADDLVSQPSGNSGARLACGTITPQ
jgi:Cu-Zn family superoxide dismutase